MQKNILSSYLFRAFLSIGMVGSIPAFAVDQSLVGGKKAQVKWEFCKFPAACQSDHTYEKRGCCVDGTNLTQDQAMSWCTNQCQYVSQVNSPNNFNNPEVLPYSTATCGSGWRCVCYLDPIDPNC